MEIATSSMVDEAPDATDTWRRDPASESTDAPSSGSTASHEANAPLRMETPDETPPRSYFRPETPAAVAESAPAKTEPRRRGRGSPKPDSMPADSGLSSASSAPPESRQSDTAGETPALPGVGEAVAEPARKPVPRPRRPRGTTPKPGSAG
jgi:hypothetical protein